MAETTALVLIIISILSFFKKDEINITIDNDKNIKIISDEKVKEDGPEKKL